MRRTTCIMLGIMTSLCVAACDREEEPVSDELQELLGQVPDQSTLPDDAEARQDAVVTTDDQTDLRPGMRVRPPEEVVERLFIVLRRGMLDQVEQLFHLPLSREVRDPLMDALRAQRLMMEAGDLEVVIKDAKASANHAVVIVDMVDHRDRATIRHELRPFYLLRIDGVWKVLFVYSDYRNSVNMLAEPEIEAFAKFDQWLHNRRLELIEEIRAEAEAAQNNE